MKKMILSLCMTIVIILLSGCTNGVYIGGVYHAAQQNEADSAVAPVLLTDATPDQPIPLSFPISIPIDSLVTMTIQDITPSGLSFFFENNTYKEFIYFPRYALYIRQNNAWQPVEPIIDWALFPDIVFGILPHSTTEIRTIDWQWLFGELSDGVYKFQKEIIFLRSPGDFDVFVREGRFSLFDNVAIVFTEARFPDQPPWGSFPPVQGNMQGNSLSVTMTLQDITPSGLSFFFENNSDRAYTHSPVYTLYVRRDNAWQPVEPIIDNSMFPALGLVLFPHSKTEIRAIDWQCLLGELPDGEYKIQTEIRRWRSLDDFDIYVMEQYFSLPQDDALDYAGFLELLAANGFLVEEGQERRGGTIDSPLSTVQRFVYVDDEMLRVEIYDSNEIMERAASLIGVHGVADPDFPGFLTFMVTWMPEASPRWFKRDLLIVFYGGNDSRIIDFLVENLTFFVGFDIDVDE
ncbi:MAG: hypothetical protein FWG63_07255 [Defluviitaleaceae bacterium]|nr:hypothetical protein [Defluviitaleaceae bacterium]